MHFNSSIKNKFCKALIFKKLLNIINSYLQTMTEGYCYLFSRKETTLNNMSSENEGIVNQRFTEIICMIYL